MIPWETAGAVFLGTVPLLGAVLWNLMDVRSIRTDLAQIRVELGQIRVDISQIRADLTKLTERVAILEERDRHTGRLVTN